MRKTRRRAYAHKLQPPATTTTLLLVLLQSYYCTSRLADTIVVDLPVQLVPVVDVLLQLDSTTTTSTTTTLLILLVASLPCQGPVTTTMFTFQIHDT